ncbi:MAG TPA: hypothetical protein PLJ62_09170 [Thermoflexales bacterium]|nr:hypothetical protein [Thermoflexales bacterium]HQW35422.1 hypothetical protein [Thermoflexales bacterium]HQZ22130.1 hypothetical protein [Thermoflexales bacterium]HRA00355.1 hypothetical protein [Thermoflexales bacterium]
MTTQSAPSGKTVRTVKPLALGRNRFERAAWMFMRYSGLVLIFLALSHFWIQHILIGTQALSQAQTVAFWGAQGNPITIGNLIFRLYYAVMLVLAMVHGLNGTRQVVGDYVHGKQIFMLIMGALTLVVGFLIVFGLFGLLIGAKAN